MSKTTRLLSAIVAVIMCVTMLSAFSVSFAIDPQKAAKKAAADVNMFSSQPFDALSSNPGYGETIQANGIVFVDDDWSGAQDGDYVYLQYTATDGTPLVYRAVKGENAFSSINTAMETKGREGLIIKIGGGTYSEGIASLAINGLKFYGNYADICPNVDDDEGDPFTKDLNPIRDSKKETVITGKWQWKKDTYNITINGFTVSGAGQFSVYNSSAYSGDIHIYNNIFKGISANYPINAGAGYTDSMYIKNNRFEGVGYILSQFGGANQDIIMENNYAENCTNSLMYFNATGTYGTEALVSFSNNVVKNCKNVVRLDYQNANYGSNLNFNRVQNNMFYGCTGDYIVFEKMHPECVKNNANVTCLDPKSKTYITDNVFAGMNGTTPAIKFDGASSVLGADIRYTVSAVGNKFLFKSPSNSDNVAVSGGFMGIMDASNFYTNANDKTGIFEFDTGFGGSIVTMPYYLDEAMTTVAEAGSLTWQDRTMEKFFDKGQGEGITYGVDTKKYNVYGKVKADIIEFTLDKTSLVADNSSYQVYYDFLLSRPVKDNVIMLQGERTLLYLLVKDDTTGQTSKYSLVLNQDTAVFDANFRYLFDKDTDTAIEMKDAPVASSNEAYYVRTGVTTYDVYVPEKEIFFPFYVVASPGAKVEYSTDGGTTFSAEYPDSTYYIKPDKGTAETKNEVKVRITAGGNATEPLNHTFTFNFVRTGTDKYDAQILRSVTPVENLVVFNNTSRLNVVYRPFAMIDEVAFDFEVSTNATYAIYTDEACTEANLVSKQGDVKSLKAGDGITNYYIKVTSKFGYEQIYKLYIYNDVKSDDNVIRGITGYVLGEGLWIENNHIVIEASSTLALVNAHFETNAFADIKVYPTQHKTYELTPSITMATVNNREVEVPTYQLGIGSNVALFWIDVTSETGATNSYTMKIYKHANIDASFKDTKGHWAEKYINDIASLGIVNGVGGGNFAPNSFATRQEMAIILCKMLGIEALSFRGVNLGEAFTDANDIAEWAYDFVKGAYALKFMVGSDGKFNPKANITRQEFFVAVASILKLDVDAAADYSLAKFSDSSSIAKWALPYTKACVKAGIVSGSDGKLNPKNNITRAEIATIVSQITTIRNEIVFG